MYDDPPISCLFRSQIGDSWGLHYPILGCYMQGTDQRESKEIRP